MTNKGGEAIPADQDDSSGKVDEDAAAEEQDRYECEWVAKDKPGCREVHIYGHYVSDFAAYICVYLVR